MHAPYTLYYWPGLPGRGQQIRLALEDAGVEYIDVAREPTDDGSPAFRAIAGVLQRDDLAPPHFAPPVLHAGDLWLSQCAVILDYLGRHHGLAPEGEAGRCAALQVQLTISDFIAEAHDTHHPAGTQLTYEEQKPEATRRAASFRAARASKFLNYFERVLTSKNEGPFLVGDAHSYPDLSLTYALRGLAYAFPRLFERLSGDLPALLRLRDRVVERPNIAAYLRSARILPFNQHGIFRHYDELDDPR